MNSIEVVSNHPQKALNKWASQKNVISLTKKNPIIGHYGNHTPKYVMLKNVKQAEHQYHFNALHQRSTGIKTCKNP
jgi:hypothetical protein